MLFFPLITGIALLVFGFYALKQNPRRPTNQVLAAVCFVSVITLALQFTARVYGERYWVDQSSNPMPWVRTRLSVIGLLCPFMIWMCYYIISGRYSGRKNLILKLLPWAAISAFLMITPFAEAFKSSSSRPDNIQNGPLFTVYLVVMLACLLSVCIASMSVAPRLAGIRQLEFRFITIAFGYLSFAAIFATLVTAVFPSIPYANSVVPTLSYLVFLAFGVSAWSVTSRRIYHSSQVALSLVERFAVAALVAFPTVHIVRWLPTFDQSSWGAAGVVALACVGFWFIDDKARALLNLKSEQRTGAFTKKLQLAASYDLVPEQLVEKLEPILRDFVDGTRVRILTLEQDCYEHGSLSFSVGELNKTSLRHEGWMSVVSLDRMTRSHEPDPLRLRLEQANIHLLVSSHWSENEPAVLVAIDERENGVPFTHPEIDTLRQLVEIVEGLYTRCRFALQARQGEQLATIGLIGAGLAHELRNPIVAIETFAKLLPHRLNDAQFLKEFAEVIPGEAKRIQALTDQLLDLSRPRKYEFVPVDVHDVISESISLLKQKARTAQVSLQAEASAEHSKIVADPQALRQVLLNLLLNSIQSIAQTNRPGRVLVRTADTERELVIETEDNGPGIPETIRSRLFRPFVSAGKEGGLGLGLAICAEIAKIHHGEISAEKRGSGALFRIILPITGPTGVMHPESV